MLPSSHNHLVFLQVTELLPGGPGQAAGVRVDDVLCMLNGLRVTPTDNVPELLGRACYRDEHNVLVFRRYGAPEQVLLELGHGNGIDNNGASLPLVAVSEDAPSSDEPRQPWWASFASGRKKPFVKRKNDRCCVGFGCVNDGEKWMCWQ